METPEAPDGSCRGQTLAKLLKLSCSWPHSDGAGTSLTEKNGSPKLFSTLACADCQSIECENCAYGEVIEGTKKVPFSRLSVESQIFTGNPYLATARLVKFGDLSQKRLSEQ